MYPSCILTPWMVKREREELTRPFCLNPSICPFECQREGLLLEAQRVGNNSLCWQPAFATQELVYSS